MKQPNEPDYPVVVYLTEPEAHFVSLVKRGANRTPFHIAKQDKETEPMKIIHRIIAKKGTDEAAIKAAVGEEASQLLKLDAPVESGAFTVYEQHKAEAFKAESLEVVSLADDNSIICLCGELAKKSEGFISKLLDKKEEKAGVEVPESMKAVKAEVLKGDFEWILFDELHAMGDAISGILGQQSSEQTDKVALIRAICDNFLKSLDTAMQVTKSDVFLPPKKEADVKEEDNTETEKSEGNDMNLDLEDKKVKQPEDSKKSEDAVKEEKAEVPTDEAKKAEETPAEVEKSEQPKDETAEALTAMKASFEEMGKQLEAMKSELDALKKAPASAVQSHADNPIPAQKSESKKSDNVFAGVFGTFSRM